MIPIIIDSPEKGSAEARCREWCIHLQNVANYCHGELGDPVLWNHGHRIDCRSWLSEQLALLTSDHQRSIVFVHSNNWWCGKDNDSIDLVALAQQYSGTLFVIYSGDGYAAIPDLPNPVVNIHVFEPIVNRNGSISFNDSNYLIQLKKLIMKWYFP